MIQRQLITAAVALIATVAGCAGSGVRDSDIGLSKTSVFNTPAPETFAYSDTKARRSKALPRAFPGAPPQVPHEMESMLPITLDDNQCLECHDRPDMIGQTEVKGGNPMSKEHYSAVGMANKVEGWGLSGARYNCTMCHAPQATNVATPKNSFIRVEGE